ncbi:hypothetical protein F4803DRAFT_540245 [Xylaria telfairii]|nr:hypothetical protein F4803DRAFT_540245 [Xylaria telfairii]
MRNDTTEHRRNITQRLKQRFFGELLRDCFSDNRFREPTRTLGTIITSPRRLVVAEAVAITLEVALLIILGSLSALFVLTRPTRRPLGLDADPSSAMSIAKLLSDDTETMRSFLTVHTSTKAKTNATPLKHQYGMEQGKLRLISRKTQKHAADRDHESTFTQAHKGKEKSTVFSIWSLIALAIVLATVMIAILTLYIYSKGHKLYQKAFVYTVSVSVGGVSLGAVNSASIVTTLVAVTISLWWGSLDTSLRKAQPFLALAMGPVTGSKGASISYRSSYLLWASARAARRKHWFLFLVCTGAFQSQILTIAMSSLWSRQPGEILVAMQIPKTLELRHVPILTTGQVSNSPRGLDRRSTALANLFGDFKTSWVYGAVAQLSLRGLEPFWSSHGWNFVPVDLESINSSHTSVQSGLNKSNSMDNLSTKVTLETTAIRGRLECSEYDFLNDTSLWMTDWRLPEDTQLSPNISHGYQLRKNLYFGLYDPQYNATPDSLDFPDSDDLYNRRTTLFSSNRRLQCCQNSTNGSIGQTSIGYWSPNLQDGSYPAISNVWPANFTVKWIRGRAIEASLSRLNGEGVPEDERVRLIWTERPQMAALNCMPIIETAIASVIVDATNGRVIDFKLLSQPQKDEFAWTDDFLAYKQPGYWDTIMNVNLTTSHGILFTLGLLGAADLQNLIGATEIASVPGSDSFAISKAERLDEQTFNFRETGLNVDYMTWAMLSLVNNSHGALLDTETLKKSAQRTFSTFFQHFVNNRVNITTGGYLYQSPEEKLPADIGEPYVGNFPNTTTATGSNDSHKSTSRIVDVSIARPMEVLSMSGTAAWICISILGYLMVTCVLLAVATRNYNRLLVRQVNSIADIAFLIAGSRKLLKLARERSLKSLKQDSGIEAKLDWFATDQGDLRWGVEVVGESDESFSPISSAQQSLVFFNSSYSSDLEEEASWYDDVVLEIHAIGVTPEHV